MRVRSPVSNQKEPSAHKCTDAGDVWTTVWVDGGQPARVSIGTSGARRLENAVVQLSLDLGPVKQWQVVKISEIGCVHVQLDRSEAETQRAPSRGCPGQRYCQDEGCLRVSMTRRRSCADTWKHRSR